MKGCWKWAVRGLVRLNSDNNKGSAYDCLLLLILSILSMSYLSFDIGSIRNTPTRKHIQIYFFRDWARKWSIMKGEECCWCVPFLAIPSNSFLKTWQSAEKSILCETRKSIFAGRRWSDSVFLPGRLSAQPWSQEQGTPTPFFPNSSFSLTPRTSLFHFLHFYSPLDTSLNILFEAILSQLDLVLEYELTFGFLSINLYLDYPLPLLVLSCVLYISMIYWPNKNSL